MFKDNYFTMSANKAINLAIDSAESLGHTYVGTEHIVFGLLSEGAGVAYAELKAKGVSAKMFNDLIKKEIGIGSPTILTASDFTPRAKSAIESARIRANEGVRMSAGTEHLLLAIITDTECMGAQLLRELKVSSAEILSDLLSVNESEFNSISKKKKSGKNNLQLMKYGRDLTELAAIGEIDEVIGREKEIERTIRILSRKTKNNPCLIGEPGVGKTAIAEGLAILIKKGNVPEVLKDKHIVALDLTGVVAGTKYRGDFEERIKRIMEETAKLGNVILFIDEMHNLIGTGSAEGAVDAANILKPALARGEIQIIGATTTEEYRKNIEKDSALERRFQPVRVEEPTKEETLDILKGIKEKYEKHHNILFSDEALNAAVELSCRYITDRFLPDKAIDLIDEAAGECVMKGKNGVGKYVKKEDIAYVVSQWTGIPAEGITQSEKDRLLNLEAQLSEQLIGQKEAVAAVSKAIKRGRLGINDENRPIGSFLFLGSPGVGKSELSKQLAKIVFGKEDCLIRLDMSEFSQQHSISNLIGAPAGYVGYEEGGRLTEQVRRKPYSVVLFDEIEKAHKDIYNLLLSILEEGELTDSLGVTVNFRNTIVILTANSCSDILGKSFSMGFGSNASDLKKEVNSRLRIIFKPELLNRLDDIIIFKNLGLAELRVISRKMLDETVRKFTESLGIELSYTEEAVEQIALIAEKENAGARPVKAAIRNNIEDFISDLVLKDVIRRGGSYTIDSNESEFNILDTDRILL